MEDDLLKETADETLRLLLASRMEVARLIDERNRARRARDALETASTEFSDEVSERLSAAYSELADAQREASEAHESYARARRALIDQLTSEISRSEQLAADLKVASYARDFNYEAWQECAKRADASRSRAEVAERALADVVEHEKTLTPQQLAIYVRSLARQK